MSDGPANTVPKDIEDVWERTLEGGEEIVTDGGIDQSTSGIEQNGLPQRDAGVPCDNCGCEKRRPDTNRCAACGRFAADPRYAYSMMTDTWYRVSDYEDLGGDQILAKSKEEVDREDVPQAWIEAVDERGDSDV